MLSGYLSLVCDRARHGVLDHRGACRIPGRERSTRPGTGTRQEATPGHEVRRRHPLAPRRRQAVARRPSRSGPLVSRIETSDQLGGHPAAITHGPSLLTSPGTNIREVSLPRCRWPCCRPPSRNPFRPGKSPRPKKHRSSPPNPTPEVPASLCKPDRDDSGDRGQPKSCANSRTGLVLARVRRCESSRRLWGPRAHSCRAAGVR